MTSVTAPNERDVGSGAGKLPPRKTAHDLTRLDLNLLLVFDALLREGNLTRAAQSLGMTQSAASHALKRLRAYFGDRLFVKAGRGMAPTSKGRALGEVVGSVVGRVRDEVLPAMDFEPQRERRTITLCLSDMGEFVFLPPLLALLKTEAPLVKVKTLQVPAHALEAVLGAGEADLAIGSFRLAPEGLYQQELFTHTLVCLVHRDLRSSAPKLTVEEYGALSHVVITLGERDTAPYDTAIDGAGLTRSIVVQTPHFLVVPWLIEQCPHFVAVVPRALGVMYARHGIVAMKEPPVPLPGIVLRQYWHPRFHHDGANRWLRQLVKRSFDALPASIR